MLMTTGKESALWKALHKADYAKCPIMERGRSERVPSACWLRQAGIPTFA